MKVYRVMTLTNKSYDQWEEFRTTNKAEAIEFAKDEKSKNTDKNFWTELWENEVPDNVNYKTFDKPESDDYNAEASNAFWFENDVIYFDFADRLNEYRKAHDLTVLEFAKKLNISKRTLENWLFKIAEPNDITKGVIIDKLDK